jgi:nicotinamidase-related amidase
MPHNGKALVIVDAWGTVQPRTAATYPGLVQMHRSFATFLNEAIRQERESGTFIIHSPSWGSPVDGSYIGHNHPDIKTCPKGFLKAPPEAQEDQMHFPDGPPPLLEEIEISPHDLVLGNIGRNHLGDHGKEQLAKLKQHLQDHAITEIAFAGFHFGRCIHDHARKINTISGDAEIKIVLNLCLLYPEDTWVTRLESPLGSTLTAADADRQRTIKAEGGSVDFVARSTHAPRYDHSIAYCLWKGGVGGRDGLSNTFETIARYEPKRTDD